MREESHFKKFLLRGRGIFQPWKRLDKIELIILTNQVFVFKILEDLLKNKRTDCTNSQPMSGSGGPNLGILVVSI